MFTISSKDLINKSKNYISNILFKNIRKSEEFNKKNKLRSGELLLKNINTNLVNIINIKHTNYKNLVYLFNNNLNEDKKYINILLDLTKIYNLPITILINLLFVIDHKLPYNIDNYKILNNIKFINNYIKTNNIKLSYKNFIHIGITNFYYSYINYRNNNKNIYKYLQNLYIQLDNNIIKREERIIIKNNKIKILFLSKYLSKRHSVFKDRSGIISNLDPSIFDIYIITDIITDHYVSNFWKKNKNIKLLTLNFNNLSILELQKIILSMNFNIIIFCEIGMCFKQYILSLSRLAPIQCNTFGHSDTSGIDTIDYFISSSYFETDKSLDYYSEKLLKLDCLSMYYEQPLKLFNLQENNIINNKNYICSLLKISNKSKLYGCFSSFMKFSIKYIEILRQILIRDKNGLLLINFVNVSNYKFKYIRYKMIFQKVFGTDINRIIFINDYNIKLEGKLYFTFLKNIDCLCETFPFGGLNSTMDALEVNQAIITLPSEYISGRFTYGIYKKMGLLNNKENTISKDKTEYINLAYKYANNIEFKTTIQNYIKKNKYKVFNEQDSITEWNKCLQKIYIDKLNN